MIRMTTSTGPIEVGTLDQLSTAYGEEVYISGSTANVLAAIRRASDDSLIAFIYSAQHSGGNFTNGDDLMDDFELSLRLAHLSSQLLQAA